MRLVATLGEVELDPQTVSSLIQEVKAALKDEEYGASVLASVAASPWIRPPRMDEHLPQVGDDHHGGRAWIPELESIARLFGNGWVPTQNHDLLGVDLSGIWSDSLDPSDRTYLRQFGPDCDVFVPQAEP